MKRIGFYSILSSGHLNVCASIGQSILNNHGDKVEIYFIVDQEWREKLNKIDSRFKFGVIEYDNSEQGARLMEMIKKFEIFLELPNVDKLIGIWQTFIEDKSYIEIDKKVEVKIRELKLDFLLCDQVFHLPSMHIGVLHGFIASANPLIVSIEGFPKMGYDCGVDEIEKIKAFDDQIEECLTKCRKILEANFEERGIKLPNRRIDQALCDQFTIYSYPKELDYYNDELKKQYNLWQIDAPIVKERIPKPFELPQEFAELPGKIIYVSLGSLFSAYVNKLQRLVDVLDKLPHKFIVSKGPNGDKLKFPSNKFIGENYVDQLAVLQVVDAMISHGGNNTFGESFYFGVKTLILPVLGDQINNAKRITETGYGYALDLLKFTEDEMCNTIKEALENDELTLKLKKISERIQREDKLNIIATKIVDYIEKL